MKKTGFTLIELLIVISVIAILMSIALPRFKGMQQEANIAKSKSDLRTLQSAVESYFIHNNAYPATLTALTTANPQIILTVPQDPFANADYGYALSANGSYFVVYSIGYTANGSAVIDNTGVVTQTNGASCIYASNGTPVDIQP